MIHAMFRIIRFPLADGDRFIGVAWNYAHACLISTVDHASYTAAHNHLELDCEERGVELRWFDGLYVCEGSDAIFPDTKEH